MPGLGVIIVGPSRYLQKIKWLRLVQLAPMRYLLVVPSGTAVDSLEVAIIDLLENLEQHEESEKATLEELRDMCAACGSAANSRRRSSCSSTQQR